MSAKRRIRRERTGCKACKTRRVKCDEEKPICQNCRHMDLECEYITDRESLLASRGLKARSLDTTKCFRDRTLSGSDESLVVHQCGPSIILPPSYIHPILPSTNLGLDLRLFNHFIKVVVPEAFSVERIPSMSAPNSLSVWDSAIPALAFNNDHIIHALLAIAARDINFKAVKNLDLRREMSAVTVKYEALAMAGLRQLLSSGQKPNLEVFLVVLILYWLSTLSADDKACQSHHTGAMHVLSLIPKRDLTSDVGRELLVLMAKLGFTASWTQSWPSITERTTPLIQASNIAPTKDEPSYELWSILTDPIFTGWSERSWMRAMTKPLSPDRRCKLLELVGRVCDWFQRVAELPEYRPQELDESQWTAPHPYGSIVYPEPSSATYTAHALISLFIMYRTLNSYISFDPPPFLYSICIRIRRIFAGLVDSMTFNPEYTRSMLRQAGTLGIFAPLLRTNDLVMNPFVQAWQIETLRRIERWYEPSVWEFLHPGHLQYYCKRQEVQFSEFMQPYQRIVAVFAPRGIEHDFFEDRCNELGDVFEPGTEFAIYVFYQLEDRVLRASVSNWRTEAHGVMSYEPDVDLTEKWCNMTRLADDGSRFRGDVEPGTVEQIIIDHGCAYLLVPEMDWIH